MFITMCDNSVTRQGDLRVALSSCKRIYPYTLMADDSAETDEAGDMMKLVKVRRLGGEWEHITAT